MSVTDYDRGYLAEIERRLALDQALSREQSRYLSDACSRALAGRADPFALRRRGRPPDIARNWSMAMAMHECVERGLLPQEACAEVCRRFELKAMVEHCPVTKAWEKYSPEIARTARIFAQMNRRYELAIRDAKAGKAAKNGLGQKITRFLARRSACSLEAH